MFWPQGTAGVKCCHPVFNYKDKVASISPFYHHSKKKKKKIPITTKEFPALAHAKKLGRIKGNSLLQRNEAT